MKGYKLRNPELVQRMIRVQSESGLNKEAHSISDYKTAKLVWRNLVFFPQKEEKTKYNSMLRELIIN